jgi:hypothetical protein
MDEEIERLVVSVRADTSAFARDVTSMRGELEGPLVVGAGRAGNLIDRSLAKAILSGKTGFDDLKKVALSAMSDIRRRRFVHCSRRRVAGVLGRVCSMDWAVS